MLARSSELYHPQGVRLRTPALIPSFSSRGFGKVTPRRAAVQAYLQAMEGHLTTPYLVSAFDIARGLIRLPRRISSDVVILDSGGYEAGKVEDVSAYIKPASAGKRWTMAEHRAVQKRWPTALPAVFVSFDRYTATGLQIERAVSQTTKYPRQMHTFLWKPETRAQRLLDVGQMQPHVRALSGFGMIGVTEKELGDTIPARLRALAALRRMMDAASVSVPIHVFGGLDPLSVILYFLAGAEVFDGLTWLRFGFRDGLALYTENYFALAADAQESRSSLQAKLMIDNYYVIVKLQARLNRYLRSKDLADLAPHTELARQALTDLSEQRIGG